MSTLLLRLASPMQAWGLDNKFERRGTMREPTKSGVIGLLAAAMGRGRDECIDDLSVLRFGVRVDQPGQLVRDYHTAMNVIGSKTVSYVTERYYLSDALFIAGFEGNDQLINLLDWSVNNPSYPLYLGRRSCPPVGRVSLGIRSMPLKEALENERWHASEWFQKKMKYKYIAKIFMDSNYPGMINRRDLPVIFNQKNRKYQFRFIDENIVELSINDLKRKEYSTEHDPFNELGG